jgi:ATP-dependent helicase/nuclease subunit B
VMTLAGSAGSIFDATVFLRATDANWPGPERANPLLPWTLQRTLRMPGTDPASTTARARAFTADLLARSSTILFTSAAEDADGHFRLSPLLREFSLPSLCPAELAPMPAAPEPIPFETVDDDTPLPAPPSSEVYGGARVLKLQAACGFQAFAELRLRATEPERAEIGLDAGESGTLLHRALQSFWSEVKTQKALRLMPSVQRDELLTRCIGEALRNLHPIGPWDAAYLTLQKERQLSILRQWLEEELKRGPFTVLAIEEEQHIAVGPLTLAVRMDRIDQIGANEAGGEQTDGVFFVDYKTGSVANPSQWEGSRPDDPQLPLYALLPEAGELKGVAFAKIRAGKDMRWLGVQSEPGILPASRGSVVNLPELLAEWRANLDELAHTFAAGRAEVNPKNYPQTCTHCAQRLLCRLDPAGLIHANTDETSEAG